MLGRRRVLDTAEAERKAEPVRAQLKFERNLRAQIERFSEQLQETAQALHLTPENVQAVVEIALQLAGQPPLQEASLRGRLAGPADGAQHACPVFHLPALAAVGRAA